MTTLPRDKAPDSSLMLLLQGYRFLPNRFREHQSNIFETRLMLQRVICVRGEDAADMFYQPGKFTRHRAMPPQTARLLLDKGSVQMQEDDQHRHRKAMFMQLMTPELIDELLRITADQWRSRIESWSTMSEVVLFKEVELLLCRAVCTWAGVTLDEQEVETRTAEFSSMVSGAGGIGPKTWKALHPGKDQSAGHEALSGRAARARGGRPSPPLHTLSPITVIRTVRYSRSTWRQSNSSTLCGRR